MGADDLAGKVYKANIYGEMKKKVPHTKRPRCLQFLTKLGLVWVPVVVMFIYLFNSDNIQKSDFLVKYYPQREEPRNGLTCA